MVYLIMSSEQAIGKINKEQLVSVPEGTEEKVTSKFNNNKISSKVDINILMDRVRVERKKEKKENIIFLSLIASVILITGVIASF